MNLEEYASYEALGLADLIRRRQVSAAELVAGQGAHRAV